MVLNSVLTVKSVVGFLAEQKTTLLRVTWNSIKIIGKNIHFLSLISLADQSETKKLFVFSQILQFILNKFIYFQIFM